MVPYPGYGDFASRLIPWVCRWFVGRPTPVGPARDTGDDDQPFEVQKPGCIGRSKRAEFIVLHLGFPDNILVLRKIVDETI